MELRAAPCPGPRPTLESGTASSSRTPGHAVPTRAYQSRHRRRQRPMRSPRRKQRPANSGPSSLAGLTKLTPYQFHSERTNVGRTNPRALSQRSQRSSSCRVVWRTRRAKSRLASLSIERERRRQIGHVALTVNGGRLDLEPSELLVYVLRGRPLTPALRLRTEPLAGGGPFAEVWRAPATARGAL